MMCSFVLDVDLLKIGGIVTFKLNMFNLGLSIALPLIDYLLSTLAINLLSNSNWKIIFLRHKAVDVLNRQSD